MRFIVSCCLVIILLVTPTRSSAPDPLVFSANEFSMQAPAFLAKVDLFFDRLGVSHRTFFDGSEDSLSQQLITFLDVLEDIQYKNERRYFDSLGIKTLERNSLTRMVMFSFKDGTEKTIPLRGAETPVAGVRDIIKTSGLTRDHVFPYLSSLVKEVFLELLLDQEYEDLVAHHSPERDIESQAIKRFYEHFAEFYVSYELDLKMLLHTAVCLRYPSYLKWFQIAEERKKELKIQSNLESLGITFPQEYCHFRAQLDRHRFFRTIRVIAAGMSFCEKEVPRDLPAVVKYLLYMKRISCKEDHAPCKHFCSRYGESLEMQITRYVGLLSARKGGKQKMKLIMSEVENFDKPKVEQPQPEPKKKQPQKKEPSLKQRDSEMATRDAKIKKLENQLNKKGCIEQTLRDQISELRKACKAGEAKVAGLNHEIVELKKQLAGLQKQVAKKDADAVALQQSIDNLQIKLQVFANDLNTAEVNLANKEEELGLLQIEAADSQQIAAQLEHYEKDNARLRHMLRENEEEQTRLVGVNVKNLNENENMVQQIRALKHDLQVSNAERDLLEALTSQIHAIHADPMAYLTGALILTLENNQQELITLPTAIELVRQVLNAGLHTPEEVRAYLGQVGVKE